MHLPRSFLSVLVFGAFFCSAAQSAQSPSLSLGQTEDSLAHAISALTLHNQYDAAQTAANRLAALQPSTGCVFSAMVQVSRFDDLGDTVALRQATRNLDTCKATGLWEALRLFELGYAHSVQGNNVQAALKTRSAAKHFKESSDPDAKAFYAIYAYYLDQLTAGISWMPFISDKRTAYIADLDKRANSSSIYWPLFATPLVWIHYDRKEFGKALGQVDAMLRKAPGHPVFLQMRADMLFGLGRNQEAVDIYLQSAQSYRNRSGESIRYWCAVGNLARMYQKMGNTEQARLWSAKLASPAFAKLRKWMPASLMDDLDDHDLLP